MYSCRLLAACLFALVAGGSAIAQVPDESAGHEHLGHWPEVSHWAHPSDTGAYVGYQVGGGAHSYHKAEPAWPSDGTWGWDYQGRFFKRRIILGWWHGRRYQGGVGAYRTDGPIVLPKD